MKNLNEYLNEDFFGNVGSAPEDNWNRKAEPIRTWLSRHEIENYTINKDLTIDVDGDIVLSEFAENSIWYDLWDQLPEYIIFNKINGNFLLSDDVHYVYPKLTTLKDHRIPKEVSGTFSCRGLLKLKSLDGCPKVVGNFNCSLCDFKDLKGGPEKVNGDFNCSYCQNLKNLVGSPKEVKGSFNCSACQNLTTLKGISKKIGKDFTYGGCPNLKEDPNVVLKNIVKGGIYRFIE